MKNKNEPLKPLRDFARRVAHEGNVLLENKNSILPIINGKVALFGRIQKDYYKSGTGSGGLVNVTDVPSFLEAFNENPRIDVNKDLVQIYDKWIAENPFNAGNGMWASEPWAQEEMEITQDLIKKIKRENETPIMIIGRTAGEDRDNHKGEGSYLLTEVEYQAIKTIKKIYGKVVVILNVGNIIDMNFIKELDVDGLLYAWHGGQDGARATVDVISGYITPSGKLPATIVKTLDNYPANKNFGNKKEVIYEEDIYVGYRFFETFYEEDVLYPFGFGLSYSTFDVNVISHQIKDNKFKLDVEVKNTGEFIGKETVQVYFSAPQGVLGKPKIELLAFKKTKLIKPKEKEIVTIEVEMSKMASYDDFGYIQKSAYVLEKGLYSIYVGTSLRNNKLALTKVLDENIVVEKLTEAMAPIKKYKRVKPSLTKDNKYKITFEAVPQRTIDLQTRIKNNFPKSFKLNNENYTLTDVLNKKITLEEFIGSLSINDMKNISLGEGMSSPKVTAGTASAFGGVTDELLEKEIPIACCSDGPSGIRMDSGGFATSLPNGTLLASTFNPSLVKDLYELEGLEMRNYDIDIILGPGMNIQRHPLNGRNFEYFSEDPLLTGIMASAVVQGLHKSGVNGSLKHFAANNQETARTIANSIISERALREIYLKGFEIAVKEAKASVIMTAYNPINGIWTASNYDLTTTILRNEWKFEGIVMTDWWAQMNTDNNEPSKENIAAMVRAQNDLYMVVPNVLEYKNNLLEEYQKGNITLGEIQRNVHNILKFIMQTPVFKRKHNIQITSNEKKIDYWFKTNETHSKYPFINQDMLTSFENEVENNLKTKFDILENKNQITYGLISDVEQSLYTFGVKPALKVDEITDILKNVNKTNIYKLPNTNWGRIDLDLNGFVYKNQLANDSWSNIEKGSIYIYAVEPKEFGKYIVELEISANLPSIYQMPFSVYVDNINKQTLTTNGTEGNKVKITSFVIIDKTNGYISFKFHKTGLNVHSINVIKHG